MRVIGVSLHIEGRLPSWRQFGGRWVPIGAAARRCAMFQQQQRHVIVGMTAGVPVYGSYDVVHN